MFTGLILHTGTVVANVGGAGGNRLAIRAPVSGVVVGESMAVNGVCLTVSACHADILDFEVSRETLRATTVGGLSAGSGVNLERSLEVGARLGGHLVTGHVDTTARILAIFPEGDSMIVRIGDFGMQAAPFLVPKGSIAVDGVSLTIQDADRESVKLVLVNHTRDVTTLETWEAGVRVNIEFDYLCRIVAHQLKLAGHLKTEVVDL